MIPYLHLKWMPMHLYRIQLTESGHFPLYIEAHFVKVLRFS